MKEPLIVVCLDGVMFVESIGGRDRAYVKPDMHTDVPDGARMQYIGSPRIQVDSGATATNIKTGTIGLLASFDAAFGRLAS